MHNTRRSSTNGKTMRILVTGHKGYIGTVMVPMLLGAGHEVVGLDTDLYEECTFCAGIQVVPDLRIDLRDIERSHLEGFAAVIHLAALSNDPLGNLNPGLTYEINHAASVRLADRSRADRKSTRLNSSHRCISYAVFCLKKK